MKINFLIGLVMILTISGVYSQALDNPDSIFENIVEMSLDAVVSIESNQSTGSGFIVTSDGYIVTNAHVIKDDDDINIITSDGQEKPAELIGKDTKYDVALLKIEGTCSYLEFEDSKNIRLGERVIAIGNPYGYSFTVTEGIVSGLNREKSNVSGYIQTDAALNPGNSGGPLINKNGLVVGINNFKIQGESMGFALSSDYIIESINKIALKELGRKILYYELLVF